MPILLQLPYPEFTLITLIQMGAQAFIFLTLALSISEALNIFNLVYQRNPKCKRPLNTPSEFIL